jgi:hypothetical protein
MSLIRPAAATVWFLFGVGCRIVAAVVVVMDVLDVLGDVLGLAIHSFMCVTGTGDVHVPTSLSEGHLSRRRHLFFASHHTCIWAPFSLPY